MSTKLDGDKLETIKTEVRCILLSSKEGLDVKEFLNEYRSMVGKPLPFGLYGYRNALDFLKALPDTVKIFKPCGGQELLTAVVNESTSHIKSLVQRQKPSAPKKGSHRPRPIQLPSNDRLRSETPRVSGPPPGFRTILPGRGWENGKQMPMAPPLMGNIKLISSAFQGSPIKYDPQPASLFYTNPRVHPPVPGNAFLPQDQVAQSPKRSEERTGSYGSLNELVPYRSSSSEELEFDSKLNQNDLTNHEDHEKEYCQGNSKPTPKDGKKVTEDSDANGIADHGGASNSADTSDQEGFDTFLAISDKMKDNFRIILKDNPTGILSTKFSQVYEEKFNARLNFSDYGCRSVHELAMACPEVFSIHSTKTVRGVHDWLFLDINSKTIAEDSSKWIPRQVLENMQELSLMYPNGIASEELPKVYQHKFKVPLDVKKLGFESLTSFLVSCQSVEYTVENGQCVVFPVEWGKGDLSSDLEYSTPDVFEVHLQHVDFLWKDLFQSFVCSPNFKYTKFVIPDKSIMNAIVADALSPDLVWLQNVESNQDLKGLMENMNHFYDEQGDQFPMSESMILPGLACSSKFMDLWHRALIYQIQEGDIKLLFVDYGTTAYVKLKEVRTLHQKFSDLPIQAIKSRLYGIAPINATGWTSAANEYFFDSCLEKVYVAEIVKTKLEIPAIEVILSSTENPKDVVNREMVAQGYATAVNEMFKNPVDESTNRIQMLETESESHPEIRRDALDFTNVGDILRVGDPQFFLSLLPYWLTSSGNWATVSKIIQQARDSAEATSLPEKLDLTVPESLSAEETISYLFTHKPELICEVWRETISLFREVIENKFIGTVLSHFDSQHGLEKLKHFDKREQSEIYDIKMEDTGQSKQNSFSTSTLNLNVEEFVPRVPVCNNDFLMENNVLGRNSLEQNSSYREAFITRPASSLSEAYSEIPIVNQELMVAYASVSEYFFHFLVFNNHGVYMVIDELFQILAPNTSPEILKMKLRYLKSDICQCISIGHKKHRWIYDFLLKLNAIDVDQRLTAIPLSLVGKFISTILPSCSSYAAKFNVLAEELGPHHSFWSENRMAKPVLKKIKLF